MASHRDLEAWKQAMTLAKVVYAETAHFPRQEVFGLASQMRRAAVSVASNIAEGSARRSRRELTQFLSIALGSPAELDTQLELARDLDFIASDSAIFATRDSAARLVTALHRSLADDKSSNRSPITDHRSPT